MLSYCLKCRRNTESKNLKVGKTTEEQWCDQTVQFVVIQNQDLLKCMKLVDYY